MSIVQRFPHFSQCFLLATALLLLLYLPNPNPAIAQSRLSPSNSNTNATKSPWRLSLNYTGALFGYYRSEADDWGKLDLDPPKKFLQPEHRYQSPLLLGVGDNFAPEFGASVERELKGRDCSHPASAPKKGSAGHKDEAPEVLYKDSDRLPKMAECDNVARFLMKAGYRAIVPGREDFIYSAVWLRRIALSLQVASKVVNSTRHFPEEKGGVEDDVAVGNLKINNDDQSLLMLAANLRWNFTPEGGIQGSNDPGWFPKEKFSDKVKKVCPLMFTWNSPHQGMETCVDGGDKGNTVTTEMDWLRRLDATVQVSPDCNLKGHDPEDCFFPVARSMNRRAHSDVTFRRQMLENEAQIAAATLSDEIRQLIRPEVASRLAATLESLGEDKAFDDLAGKDPQLKLKDEKQLDVLDTLGELTKSSTSVKDLNLILTALHQNLKEASNSNKDPLLSPEAIRAAIRLLLRKIAAEQKNVGYTIVKNGPMAGTLIIGVIGRETMKALSPGNLQVCTRFEGGQGRDGPCVGAGSNSKLEGTVVVGDPLFAVTTVLRGAWRLKRDSADKPNSQEDEFDKVVVMAQMPRTEAEELAAHSAVSLRNAACSDLEITPSADEVACPDRMAEDAQHIDLILSEAQTPHTTPDLEVTYARHDMVPVVAPKPAWIINRAGTALVEPVSTVTITGSQLGEHSKRTLTNREPPTNETDTKKPLPTMAELLHEVLKQVALQRPSADLANLENFWNGCQKQKACQNSVVTQYLFEQIHRSSHADVVLLENRDLYFGRMFKGYENYDICDEWVETHKGDLSNQQESITYCRLRMALDRILWKGDYSERVIVDGKNLEQMLTIAQQETESEQALIARDTVEEWLMTFGIVTHPPDNLSAASMGPVTFAIPGVAFCTDPGANAGASKYCINGQRLTDDGAYWVATSDHLAEENQVYRILKSLDPTYHLRKRGLFITGEIADEVFRHNRDEASEKLVRAPDADIGMRKVEELQQKRPILQIDFAKWVAGFMVRRPNRSNTELAANFSGVTDSRATTPSAQELDLEAVTRTTSGVGVNRLSQRLKFGVQSDLEYDRAVTGNLNGTPPTVTYALNSFSTGGFVQFRLRNDLTPRLFLVLAPYQYQTQITGNFLNFNLSTGSGQITVSTPRSKGFSHRLGVRYEFGGHWADSYAESGPEYSNIDNVLSGLLLPNGSVCPVSATAPLATCVPNNIVVTSSTVLTPQTETLHTGGLYWDVHLQYAPSKEKRWSLTLDTKGDDFLWPGATLATQSRYAFTTTEAVNFKVIGNLQLSPTYSQFFYRNQGQGLESNSLMTKTFSVVAKWYFARDAAVPFWRQLLFLGPTSLDQTKSAKLQ